MAYFVILHYAVLRGNGMLVYLVLTGRFRLFQLFLGKSFCYYKSQLTVSMIQSVFCILLCKTLENWFLLKE